MRSLPIQVGLLSLALIANFAHGRKDSGKYWEGVVQENVQRSDCHDPSNGEISFSRDFEPKPIAKAFTTGLIHATSNEIEPNSEISFVRDFEPKHMIYDDVNNPINPNGEISLVREFGPKPIARAFTTDHKHMASEPISLVRDFGPKPIAIAFTTDNNKHITSKDDEISFVRDFEPKPSSRAFVLINTRMTRS
ncbi:hypothetical protein ACS0TY_001741 [Phlomoides rotata]